MADNELILAVQDKVGGAARSVDIHTDQRDIIVGYVCFFPESDSQFSSYRSAVDCVGEALESTATGPVFEIPPLSAVAGPLRILEFHNVDKSWSKTSNANFYLPDNPVFKSAYLGRFAFKLIPRGALETIEQMELGVRVRECCSNLQ